MEIFKLIPLIGFSLAWQRYRGTTSSAAVLHIVSLLMIALYLAALIGILKPVTVLLILGGSLLAITEGIHAVKSKATIPVPLGIFTILSILFWLVHSNSQLFHFDEYSHWGVFLKEVLANDALWGSDSNALHPHYLPGPTLWQYFFAVFSTNAEGAGFLAQFTLLIAPVLVMWEKTEWHDYLWHIGIFALLTVLVSNFGHGFASLYVDHVLGIWFVGSLLHVWFAYEDGDSPDYVGYLLPLAVIVLLKSVGIFFALGSIGIVTILLLLRPSISTSHGNSRSWRVLLFPTLALVFCFSVVSAWDTYREAEGIGSDPTSTAGVLDLVLSEAGTDSNAASTELTRRFKDVVLHQQISKDAVSAKYHGYSYAIKPLFTDSFRLTTFSTLGLSLILFAILGRLIIPVGQRAAWFTIAASVWLMTIGYLMALFFGYRSVADIENGILMSSYIRYLHSMLLPLILLWFVPLIPAFSTQNQPVYRLAEKIHVRRSSVIFAAGLALLVFFERPYLEPVFVTRQAPEVRATVEPLTSKLRAEIGAARVWTLFPAADSNGFFSSLLKYHLSPGPAWVEEDTAKILGDQEALKAELRNWEYMWFPVKDPELDLALERLIGAEVVHRVYRIDSSGDEIVFEAMPDIF